MSDENKSVEKSGSEETPAGDEQTPFYEFKGRKFDSKSSLDAFIEGVTHAQGSIAQKYGELKQEVEPLRRYNLKSATVDEAAIAKQVAELQDEGNHAEATKLLFEYTRQVKADSNVQLEKTRLWNDYVKSRKDKVFDVLDEDMARDHVFSNYEDKLQEVEDPFQLLDNVLIPKASRMRPESSDDSAPAATLGSGNIGSEPVKTPEKDEPKPGQAFDEMLDEFNNVFTPKK